MSTHRRLLIVLVAVPVCLAATVWAQDSRPQRRERESLTISERIEEFRRTFMGLGQNSQSGERSSSGGNSSSQSRSRSSPSTSRASSAGRSTSDHGSATSSSGRSTSRQTARRATPPPSQQAQQRPARLTDALFGTSSSRSSSSTARRQQSSSTARRQSSSRQPSQPRMASRQPAREPTVAPPEEPQEAEPTLADDGAARSSRRTFQPGYRASDPLPTLAAPPADDRPASRVAARPQPARGTPTPAPRVARQNDDAAREALREADETLHELEAEEAADATGGATAPGRPNGSADLPRMTVDDLEQPATSTNPDEFVVTRRAPELRVETSGPRRLVVGQPAHYKVALYNAGEIPAEEVAVTIALPDWAEVVATEATVGEARPAAESTPGTFRWTVPTLKARSRQELKLDVVVHQDREFELAVTWTSAAAEAVATIDVSEPKLELALAGPKEVSFGEKSIFKLTFTNPGSADAENVVVRLLPLEPGVDTAESHTLGRLAAGASREVELELVARQQGQLKIDIEATADGGLKAAVSREVQVRRAGLSVAVEAPKFQYSGASAAYNLTVTNDGDEPADNVRVTAKLPRGAKFVAASDEGSHDSGEEQVAWTLKTLAPGETRVLSLRCTLEMSGPNQLFVEAAADGDLTATAKETTEVEATADLVLEVRQPTGPTPVDEDAIYEIVVRNRGAKAAQVIEVVGFFSMGIDPVRVEGGQATIEDGKVLLAPLASLAAGDERVFKIVARAHFRGNHIFRAEVHCHAPESALAQEGTTRYYAANEDPDADDVAEPAADEPAADEPTASTAEEPEASAESREPTPAGEEDDAAEESAPSEPTPADDPAEDTDVTEDAGEEEAATTEDSAAESTEEPPGEEEPGDATGGSSNPHKWVPADKKRDAAEATVGPADEADVAEEAAANKPARLGWRPRRQALKAAEAGAEASGTLR